MYIKIFAHNVIRLLDERDMTRADLSKLSGVSNAFLADLKDEHEDNPAGKGFNPSLKVMQAIAFALDVPLANLLDPINLSDEAHRAYFESLRHSALPNDLVRIVVTLPRERLDQVEKWSVRERRKLDIDRRKQDREQQRLGREQWEKQQNEQAPTGADDDQDT